MRRLLVVVIALFAATAVGADTIVVGSKNFEESRLLAEMFVQVLESRTDLEIERRFGLAGTQVCFQALRTGAIDVYPEYTGTGLVSLLGLETVGDAATTYRTVRKHFFEKWDLWWLAPLGFENAYELAVPAELAAAHDLETISDLRPLASGWTAGLGYEFVQRPDGLPGLVSAYDLRFAEVRPMQQALKYRAAVEGSIQVLDVYTTDGKIDSAGLVVLQDDLGFFPPYEAAPLARAQTLRDHPEVALALGLLAYSLDEQTMRYLNARLQKGRSHPKRVAADALTDLGLSANPVVPDRPDEDSGLGATIWRQRRRLLDLTLRHLGLTGTALLLGIAVAVPLGLLLERRPRFAEPTIRLVGLTQTVPSIALLAFMIPLFGIGVTPAIVALWIYSIFPILRSTYTGLRDAAPDAVAAGTALGMTDLQILLQVRLPLAIPVIMAGIRTAAVISVGTATLAAFIGAGGLGEPIVAGLQLADTRMILSGALPAAVLAVAVDLTLARVERRMTPYSGSQTS